MRVTIKTWNAICERDSGICRYCGTDLLASYSTFGSATVDHIVAVSEGGSDLEGNLVLSCPTCNSILSRSGHLRSFAERKEYVQQAIAKKMDNLFDMRNRCGR
jgi:5-methylcytosine-specific restriction endonuclease McrA